MGAVLAAVGVACCGAFAFGYHLGVVNGPLDAIAKELGFAGNKALQGLVRGRGGGAHVECTRVCPPCCGDALLGRQQPRPLSPPSRKHPAPPRS
jgi:hypothetical protein